MQAYVSVETTWSVHCKGTRMSHSIIFVKLESMMEIIVPNCAGCYGLWRYVKDSEADSRLGEVKGLIWHEQVDGKSDSCGLDRRLSWGGWSRNIGLLSWNAWSVWQGRSRGWRRLGGRGARGREVVRHRAGEGRWWSLEESKDKNTKVMCMKQKRQKAEMANTSEKWNNLPVGRVESRVLELVMFVSLRSAPLEKHTSKSTHKSTKNTTLNYYTTNHISALQVSSNLLASFFIFKNYAFT